ncbi:MAG: SHOCT domain-containing protein [Novosphingobium sp.]
MADWIEKLERLNALHKAGALTDAEFAAQKAVLLADKEREAVVPPPAPAPSLQSGPVYQEPVYDEPPRGGIPKWAMIGVPAALVVALAAWFGASLVKPGPDKEITGAPSAAASDAAVAMATPSAAAVLPVALDGTLKYAAADQCKAGPVLESIYKKLDAAMDLGSGKGVTVKLDAWDTPLSVWAKSVSSEADMTTTQDAALKFPDATTWHGLRLSRVTTHRSIPEGTDSTYTRTISFLEPADKVQKTLARLGFGAPREPDYSPLEDEACGGSAQVVALNGGSALSCSWGC